MDPYAILGINRTATREQIEVAFRSRTKSHESGAEADSVVIRQLEDAYTSLTGRTYYYARDGARFGPLTDDELKQLAAYGQLLRNDLIWKEGMANWVEAARLDWLSPWPTGTASRSTESGKRSSHDLTPSVQDLAAASGAKTMVRTQSRPDAVTRASSPSLGEQRSANSEYCPSFLGQLVRELVKWILAAPAQLGRLASYWSALSIERRAQNRLMDASLSLVKALCRVGVGDPLMREQLALIREQMAQINEAETAGGGNRRAIAAARLERRELLVRFAAIAEARGSPAGAERDFSSLVSANRRLAKRSDRRARLRALLYPVNAVEWLRLLVGTLCAAIIVLAIVLPVDVFTPRHNPKSFEVRDVRLPVLAVNESRATGKLYWIDVKLERSAAVHEPVQLSIAEDTPGGSGPTLRSSIWLAIVVAGLERQDDLSGLRVSVHIPEKIDGPSAGGIVCLAILSQIDGQRFPTDLAFTGSILPDGSIGQVGSLVHKIRAAQGSVIRRILIPDYVRLEPEHENCEPLDLKALAERSGLELIAVDSIQRAYTTAVGPVPSRETRGVHQLHRAQVSDSVMMQRTKSALAEANAELVRLTNDEQTELANADFGAILGRYDRRARKSLETGRLYDAQQNAGMYWVCMKAASETFQFLRTLPSISDAEFARRCDAEAAARIAGLPEHGAGLSVLEASGNPLIVQFASDPIFVKEAARLWLTSLDEQLKFRASVIIQSSPNVSQDQELRATIRRSKVTRLLLASCVKHAANRAAADEKELGGAMPSLATRTDRLLEIEEFFHVADHAAQEAFQTTVVAEAAAMGISDAELRQRLLRSPFQSGFVELFASNQAAEVVHAGYRSSIGDTNASTANGIRATLYSIASLAKSSAIIAAVNELEGNLDDEGRVRFGRPEVLSNMIDRARQRAYANIENCKREGIPCPTAISLVESADVSRDDPDENKLDVLSSYWTASLQAQALIMLFGN